ncbi:UDP-N-acetylglucosamine--N-acetylmuramyl-(pentapeptide) pyrophosphoryl-undecaprenol N-acetylglucosamine transferase [Niabella hibiscisoli]|uniref:UDP-N-acetylglucosamine--N-acetylmuramyl- (pentapeptide) pyrophosphoryl-undecaprenol N-acetylglucosamine transferase n=1 Tax=Niabella hibiscisoli TaxID=1825928 RepID=UPI001F116CB3|nr:glycosyltransferase [Niabella hibiscisoli]MCH5714711.1 hypothetical protein [Niabella hibiscisoli]
MKAGLQVIWQTGKSLAAEAAQQATAHKEVWANEFITNMEFAYAAADIVIARAGAMTVAEICVVKKPAIFVPYPFAAEDHQTVNARQLVNKSAALMVKDVDAKNNVVKMAVALAADEVKRKEMSDNLSRLAITDAAERVAGEILNTIQ